MKTALAKVLTHRDFLKMCGLAALGAGAGQLVQSPKPAFAADLNVYGNIYLQAATGPTIQITDGTAPVAARVFKAIGNQERLDLSLGLIEWHRRWGEIASLAGLGRLINQTFAEATYHLKAMMAGLGRTSNPSLEGRGDIPTVQMAVSAVTGVHESVWQRQLQCAVGNALQLPTLPSAAGTEAALPERW